MNKFYATSCLMLASSITFAQDVNNIVKGSLITSPDQIKPMLQHTNSNAYAAGIRSIDDLKMWLDSTPPDVTVVLGIEKLFKDENGFYTNDVTEDIINVVQSSNNQSNIIWMYDEPMWHSLLACVNGNQIHCEDVLNDYSTTLSQLNYLDSKLNNTLGTSSFHVEAYTVIMERVNYHQKEMIMMSSAKYLGFDCYNGFESCGDEFYGIKPMSILEYNAHVYNFLIKSENEQPIDRKLAIIPGTFTTNDITLEQSALYLLKYKMLIDSYPNINIGLIGFFTWNDVDINNGAYNKPVLQEIMKLY